MDLPVEAGVDDKSTLYLVDELGVTHHAMLLHWYSVDDDETFDLLRRSREEEMRTLEDTDEMKIEWNVVERESEVGRMMIVSGEIRIADPTLPVYFWECCVVRNGVIIDLYLTGRERVMVEAAASRYLHSIKELSESRSATDAAV